MTYIADPLGPSTYVAADHVAVAAAVTVAVVKQPPHPVLVQLIRVVDSVSVCLLAAALVGSWMAIGVVIWIMVG